MPSAGGGGLEQERRRKHNASESLDSAQERQVSAGQCCRNAAGTPQEMAEATPIDADTDVSDITENASITRVYAICAWP